MIVEDQMQRKVELKGVPKRIVSLVPSITELIVDLGLEDSLVGITKFCVHPSDLRRKKTVVGGTKSVKMERIQALKPDIILCNKEENTKDMINQLEKIAPVHVSDIYTMMDALELIALYADIFSVEYEAKRLLDSILNEDEKFKNWLRKEGTTKKVAYFIWKNPYMVVGSKTFINSMLYEAGFENVFAAYDRYPEIQLEDDLLKNADCIFLSSEPFPFKTEDVEFIKQKFPTKEVKIVDGEPFSWYGSRMQYAFEYFKSLHL
jgi:ABC-type Fe3+-hydroxamate transport system substrate-binding protein